MEQGVARECMV